MNPGPEPLNLVGAVLTAIRKAQEGVILTVRTPPAPDSLLLSEDLHIALFPVLSLNFPPGTEPNPETIREARPERHLMLRTHRGPLPEILEQHCEDLAPDLFAPVIGQTITGALSPTSDEIILAFGIRWVLEVNLTGVKLHVKAEAPADVTAN